MSGKKPRDLVAKLEARYGCTLPREYAEALRAGALDAHDGKRPPTLPGWGPSMSHPLTFEPEIVGEVFGGFSWTEDHEGFVPLARFLTDKGDQLHDMDDFLALDGKGRVVLCDHEGDVRVVAKTLAAFLAKLR